MKTFIKSFRKLDALALSLSGMKQEDELDLVIKCQPQLKMFYWNRFPVEADIVSKLFSLSAVRIFGAQGVMQEQAADVLLQLFQSPFMQQVTHFHVISMWTKSYGDDPLPDSVEQEIHRLHEGKLKDLAIKNGYLQDVFMQELALLNL